MALIAASGYEVVARVVNIVAPSMIAVFADCGLVALHQMNITSASLPSEEKILDRCSRLAWYALGRVGIVCVVITGWDAEKTLAKRQLQLLGAHSPMAKPKLPTRSIHADACHFDSQTGPSEPKPPIRVSVHKNTLRRS